MDEQQRLLERLPDYLNGHVAGDDARRIAALLASDPAWLAQAELLADVRDAIGAQEASMDSATGLDELRRRIATAPLAVASPAAAAVATPAAAAAATEATAAAATTAASKSTAPVAGWWQRLRGSRLLPVFAPAIMATLATVCVVQGWMLANPPDAGVAWRAAPLSVAAPAANLRVRFDANASLAQVEAALAQANAGIVAGPQGAQVYLLQADDAAAALLQLRASAAVAEASVIGAGPVAPRP